MEKPDSSRARLTVNLKVNLKLATVEQFVERFAPNISRTGIFVRAKEPIPVGSRVKFEYRLADGSRVLRGLGVVRTARAPQDAVEPEQPPGMGIEFVDLDPASEQLIAELVTKHGEGARAPRRERRLTQAPKATAVVPSKEIDEARLDSEETTALDALLSSRPAAPALPDAPEASAPPEGRATEEMAPVDAVAEGWAEDAAASPTAPATAQAAVFETPAPTEAGSAEVGPAEVAPQEAPLVPPPPTPEREEPPHWAEGAALGLDPTLGADDALALESPPELDLDELLPSEDDESAMEPAASDASSSAFDAGAAAESFAPPPSPDGAETLAATEPAAPAETVASAGDIPSELAFSDEVEVSLDDLAPSPSEPEAPPDGVDAAFGDALQDPTDAAVMDALGPGDAPDLESEGTAMDAAPSAAPLGELFIDLTGAEVCAASIVDGRVRPDAAVPLAFHEGETAAGAPRIPHVLTWVGHAWPTPRARIAARRLGLTTTTDEAGRPALVSARGDRVVLEELLETTLRRLAPPLAGRAVRVIVPAGLHANARLLLERACAAAGLTAWESESELQALLRRPDLAAHGQASLLGVFVGAHETRLMLSSGRSETVCHVLSDASWSEANALLFACIAAALRREHGVDLDDGELGRDELAAQLGAPRDPEQPWSLTLRGESVTLAPDTLAAALSPQTERLILECDCIMAERGLEASDLGALVLVSDVPPWPGLTHGFATELGRAPTVLTEGIWMRIAAAAGAKLPSEED